MTMSYSEKYKGIVEFGKILVEWGNVYQVDEDDFSITTRKGNSPVVIKTKKGNRPLKLFVGDLDDRDAAYLNLYVDTLGHTAEKDWFYSTRSIIAGNLIKRLILSIAEYAMSEDGDYPADVVDIVSPYAENIDENTLKDIKKLDANTYGTIIYSRPKRTAVLTSSILDDDFMRKKIRRKKSLKVIQQMFEDLLGTKDVKEEYRHKATVKGLQRTDAILHIMLKLSQSLNEFTMALLDIDLHPVEIESHLEHLAEYRKKCYWAATGELVSEHKAKKEDEEDSNWLRRDHDSLEAPIGGDLLGGGLYPDPLDDDLDFDRPKQVIQPNELFAMASMITKNPFVNANDLLDNYNPSGFNTNPFGRSRMPYRPDDISPFKPIPIRK